jgi:hypothetical protein
VARLRRSARYPTHSQHQPAVAIRTIQQALLAAGPRPAQDASRGDKKNYAERFSRHVATCVANALRRDFPGIKPDELGANQETPARTAKGFKKLDVNYSTPELGLALGVSVKSINFSDGRTHRYTKNYSRNDNELRAEATDYHQRQPYSVLVGVLFLPVGSCDDAAQDRRQDRSQNVSSFGAAVKFFRIRANRQNPRDDVDLFERFFVGLYEDSGETLFFDVMRPPPRNRRPHTSECLGFDGFITEIVRTYRGRNDPPFDWAQ